MYVRDTKIYLSSPRRFNSSKNDIAVNIILILLLCIYCESDGIIMDEQLNRIDDRVDDYALLEHR